MRIFVLRHGHAEADAPTDRQRPLSLEGVHEVRAITTRCAADLAEVSLAYVSPYLRAQQTFNVVREVLPSLRGTELDLIVPGGNTQKVIDFLYEKQARENPGAVLLVSHQPFAGTFVDRLCGLETGVYRIGTAGLAAMDVDPVAAGCGKLIWLKHP